MQMMKSVLISTFFVCFVSGAVKLVPMSEIGSQAGCPEKADGGSAQRQTDGRRYGSVDHQRVGLRGATIHHEVRRTLAFFIQ